jgi:hypothetical protein
MFEHFTSAACEFSQPLLSTPQKFTSMEVMLIFSHCGVKPPFNPKMPLKKSKRASFSEIADLNKYG